jgi:hypothetical protein
LYTHKAHFWPIHYCSSGFKALYKDYRVAVILDLVEIEKEQHMGLAIGLASMIGCTDKGSEDSGFTSNTPVYEESDLSGMWDTLNTLISGTNPGYEPTEDSSTGYTTATAGTTDNGMSGSVYSYAIDGDAVYGGESFNQPTWVFEGAADSSYSPSDYTAETGAVAYSAVQSFVISNGESEKNPTDHAADKFPSGVYWGNVYGFGYEINDDTPCFPLSPVRSAASFLQTESDEVPAELATWFSAIASTQSQTALSDGDLGWPDQDVSGVVQYPPHPGLDGNLANENINGMYRVLAGPYPSDSELGSGYYQQEYGVVPQQIDYSNFALGVFPADFMAESPDVCVLGYESDALYGSTGFAQAPVPVTAIMDDLVDAGEDEKFQVTLINNLDDQQSVIAAYCKPDGSPVYDYDDSGNSPVPEAANATDWLDAGYTLIDASQVYCGADILTGYSGNPMSAMSIMTYEFERVE